MQSKTIDVTKSQTTVLFEKLAAIGETFEPENYATIIQDSSNKLVPELIELLLNGELLSEDSPGGGLVPVHATNILKELKALDAVEAMLEVLPNCNIDDYLYSEIILALRSFGTPVLEPALKTYEKHKNTSNNDFQPAVCEILANIGTKDSRIYSILLEMLDRDAAYGASYLHAYGDPAAVPLLSDLLDETTKHDPSRIIELTAAIESLGGTLSKKQEKLLNKVRNAGKSKRVFAASEKVPVIYRLPKPGVNIRF